MTSILSLSGLVISCVGVIPILVSASVIFSKRRRGRRFVGFDRRCAVDVVLTLSLETPSPPDRRVIRPLTGIGQVIGATEVSKCLGRFYVKKLMRVHMSGHITNRLDGDEVILGGPVRNEEAERFVKQITDLGDIAVFKYNDAGPYSLFIRTAENKTFEIDKYEPNFSGGFPRRDLCIIMAASLRNMSAQRRRVIWCSGFTSYGTSAGAQYFFDDLARMSRQKLRLLVGSQRRFDNWGMLIIEAEFSGPSITRITPLFWCGASR